MLYYIQNHFLYYTFILINTLNENDKDTIIVFNN